jgi:hypothetical protein
VHDETTSKLPEGYTLALVGDSCVIVLHRGGGGGPLYPEGRPPGDKADRRRRQRGERAWRPNPPTLLLGGSSPTFVSGEFSEVKGSKLL